jgi:hypothetical protein
MPIKKAYYYLFYTLYKTFENAPSKWWSDWKATFSLLVIEIWLLLSMMVYYKVLTKKDLIPDNRLTIVSVTVVVILSISKYFIFEHGDRWKLYVQEFNQWPKEKNRRSILIAWIVVLVILANLIFSFYLLSKVAN